MPADYKTVSDVEGRVIRHQMELRFDDTPDHQMCRYIAESVLRYCQDYFNAGAMYGDQDLPELSDYIELDETSRELTGYDPCNHVATNLCRFAADNEVSRHLNHYDFWRFCSVALRLDPNVHGDPCLWDHFLALISSVIQQVGEEMPSGVCQCLSCIFSDTIRDVTLMDDGIYVALQWIRQALKFASPTFDEYYQWLSLLTGSRSG